jgi:hypothetical protein
MASRKSGARKPGTSKEADTTKEALYRRLERATSADQLTELSAIASSVGYRKGGRLQDAIAARRAALKKGR